MEACNFGQLRLPFVEGPEAFRFEFEGAGHM